MINLNEENKTSKGKEEECLLDPGTGLLINAHGSAQENAEHTEDEHCEVLKSFPYPGNENLILKYVHKKFRLAPVKTALSKERDNDIDETNCYNRQDHNCNIGVKKRTHRP